MTGEDMAAAISAARALLRPHLDRSKPLRQLTRFIGRLLIEEADRSHAAHSIERLKDATAPPARTDIADRRADDRVPDVQIDAEVALQLGGARQRVTVRTTPQDLGRVRAERAEVAASESENSPTGTMDGQPRGSDDIDLSLIEQRCALKAASCRLMIQRRIATADDPSADDLFVPRIDEMIATARSLPSCFLWVFWREKLPPNSATLNLIADCYDAASGAAALIQTLQHQGDQSRKTDFENAFALAAEAASALRVSLSTTWLTTPDVDQDELHQMIRYEAQTRRFFLDRHMTLADPADPNDATALRTRIVAFAEAANEHTKRLKQIREAFGAIRYHLRKIDLHAVTEDDAHDMKRIAETIESLLETGVPASDVAFRDLISEPLAVALLHQELTSPAITRVIESVRDARQRAIVLDTEASTEPPTECWSTCVLQVREQLTGGVMVLLGGEPRPDAIARIKRAFHLAEVNWIRLEEHGPSLPLYAPIRREETSLVVSIVKLSGHAHVDAAKAAANVAGKPYVMLKAGYNPEQIADAVMQQASAVLATESTPPARSTDR